MLAAEAQDTISEWRDAISLITEEGGVPALAVSDSSGVTQQELNNLNKSSEYIFKPSAASDHTAELQDAIDYCAANSLNCKPIGLFKISGKIVIKGETVHAVECKHRLMGPSRLHLSLSRFQQVSGRIQQRF